MLRRATRAYVGIACAPSQLEVIVKLYHPRYHSYADDIQMHFPIHCDENWACEQSATGACMVDIISTCIHAPI